jgi:uncharacterized membrane protein YcaP (DUF421 family)
MIFDSWTSIGRTLLAGATAYVALVLMLRVSGKRTLSKLNAFDLVVTVALGSTLSAILTSKQVPLADGVVALGLLVALQFAVAWVASRSRFVNRIAKSEPRILFRRGAFAVEAMRRERVTEDEVLAAVRKAAVASLDDVEVVILESSGDLSVLRRVPDATEAGARGALRGVRFPREESTSVPQDGPH